METLAGPVDEQVIQDKLSAFSKSLPAYEQLGERELEDIYAQGHRLFQRGRLGQAAEVFSLLILYRPNERRYLLACGMCHKLQSHFELAFPMFFCALQLDETDPKPALHLAQCLFALKQDVLARQSLERLLHITAGKTEHAELRALAHQWLSAQEQEHE